MDRRAFLVALTPLVAGCFGGQRSQPTPTATETSEPTPTATPEPTPTATPEPTPTPEPEASPEAAQHIDDAQDRLTEAVYVYTGGVTDDLLSVTAEAEEFRARDVLLRLDRVQRAIAAAEADANTDEQRATIASLDTMQRFLTLATDAQSWLIDGHEALTEVYTHLDERDLSDAEADIERIETASDEVSEPTATIKEEMNPDSATVTDAIDADEYEEKVAQLTDEADVLDGLSGDASDIHEGISMIVEARDDVGDDRDDEAADTADRAYELLTDVEDRIDERLSDLPDRAEAFEDVAEDMLDLASSRAADAESIYDTYS
jgi:gas vesicle protein